MVAHAADFELQALGVTADDEVRCRAYSRAKLTLSLVELAALLSVLTALTLTGASRQLLALFELPGVPVWAGHLGYLLLIGFFTRVALLPAQFLNEWWAERKYGVGRQSAGHWGLEWLTRSAVFGLFTVMLLFPLVETLPWWPWLILPWSMLFPFCRTFFFDYVYYPILDRFYPAQFLRHETFAMPGVGRVTLPVYAVRVSHKTARVNASIRLRGKKTAIYVTDTLLEHFTGGEERVVMAHEFGHLYDHLHLEEHTRAGVAQAQRKLMLNSAQMLAGFVALCLTAAVAPALHLKGAHDLAAFPLLAALTVGLAHALSPLLCAEARRDERDADEYALAATGDVESYLSVMDKLRRLNLEETCPNPISRLLFDTHPSYTERIHVALHYRRRHHPRCRHFRGDHHRHCKNIRHHDRR